MSTSRVMTELAERRATTTSKAARTSKAEVRDIHLKCVTFILTHLLAYLQCLPAERAEVNVGSYGWDGAMIPCSTGYGSYGYGYTGSYVTPTASRKLLHSDEMHMASGDEMHMPAPMEGHAMYGATVEEVAPMAAGALAGILRVCALHPCIP